MPVRSASDCVGVSNFLRFVGAVHSFIVICLWIVFFVLKKTVIAQDPPAHYFQARIFEHFKFFAPVPAVPDFFPWQSDLLVMYRDRWFGMFFPGYALLIAATIPLRGEWIVSPLLGAITVDSFQTLLPNKKMAFLSMYDLAAMAIRRNFNWLSFIQQKWF